MDIDKRIEDALLAEPTNVDKEIKSIVIDVLEEVLERGHDLGGMHEYGRGWNDRGIQIKILVMEMIERWRQ